MKNKNITPRNDKNQPHGYWEYYYNDQLVYKCFYINGKENGFDEIYWNTGKIRIKNYYL